MLPTVWYLRTDAARVLRMDRRTLEEYLELGVLPYEIVEGRRSLPRDYVEGLAALLESAQEKNSLTLVALFYQAYLYDNSPINSMAKRRAVARCRELVAAGDTITLQMFAERLSHVAQLSAIERWAIHRRIATVKVGQVRYLSNTYAKRLENYLGWELVSVAAARLMEDRRTLAAAYRSGRIMARLGPDRRMRLKPGFKWPPDPRPLPRAELSKRLGVTKSAVYWAIERGDVISTGKGHCTGILREEAAAWQERFATLNLGFEWLQPYLAFYKPGYVSLLLPVETKDALGVGLAALGEWARDNLIPYYVRGFSSKRVKREYIKEYVDGLVSWADSKPVTKVRAREYARRCFAARRIL